MDNLIQLAHIDILLKIIFAHLVGDFLFQPDKWVEEKQKLGIKSKYLYIHSLIHGILVYIIIAQWNMILIPFIIFISHLIIDLIKSYLPKELKWFLLDQFLHFLSILIIWLVYFNQFVCFNESILLILKNNLTWIYLIAYTFIIWPTSTIINQATNKWQKEINTEDTVSLKDAGKLIGRIERILTLTFILTNQFIAIGFLLTAKSIFRFGDMKDNKDQKFAEYILIGTLLSFGITIIVGLFIKIYVLNKY